MTAKSMYERFKTLFPYLEPATVKYQVNHEDGGIDIFMDNDTVFNFKIDGRNQWTLKRVR